MAKALQNFTFVFLILLSSIVFTANSEATGSFSRSLSPSKLGLKKEKLSHFHFYFHDIVSGRKPTVVKVTEAAMTKNSSTLFGAVFMMDDPLTVGPEASSKEVGRAQGIYASASQTNLALLMVLNFAFTEGKYKGSNLSILGRNAVLSGVREMPIIGGSGLFRFARGYAKAKTYSFDPKTGDAIVDNLSILGRNAVFSGVKEMPIVGGSGLFRFARGYAKAETYSLDQKTGDAIVEYNVFVLH